MMACWRCAILLCGGLLLPAAAGAQPPGPGEAPPLGVETQGSEPWQDEVRSSAAAAPAAPALIVEDPAEMAMVAATGFHQALREADRAAALALLAADLSVIDDGQLVRPRDAYAQQWLDADIATEAEPTRQRLGREVYTSGDIAWVISDWRAQPHSEAGELLVERAETLVLQRGVQGWVITHMHRSERRRPVASPPPAVESLP